MAKARFNYASDALEHYRSHDGQEVEIIGPLSTREVYGPEPENQGPQMYRVQFPDGSYGSVFEHEMTPIGDMETPPSTLDTYTEIGKQMGPDALAFVATVMQHSAAENQAIQSQIKEYDQGRAETIAKAYLDMLEEIATLNERLDSIRLQTLLNAAWESPAMRAAQRLIDGV